MINDAIRLHAELVKIVFLLRKTKGMDQKAILCNYMQERPKTISFIMLSVLTNATKIYSMKPLLMVCLLTIMLLCALLLHAAGKNKKPITTKKITEQEKSVRVQKDIQFVPNAIIL